MLTILHSACLQLDDLYYVSFTTLINHLLNYWSYIMVSKLLSCWLTVFNYNESAHLYKSLSAVNIYFHLCKISLLSNFYIVSFTKSQFLSVRNFQILFFWFWLRAFNGWTISPTLEFNFANCFVGQRTREI